MNWTQDDQYNTHIDKVFWQYGIYMMTFIQKVIILKDDDDRNIKM